MTSNFFDSVTEAINGGVAYADRKTQIIRYRSELSTLAKQKSQAFSDLGQAVLSREASNQQFMNAYASQVSAIRSLEQRENELKMQIDALQQQDVASNAGGQPQSGKVCSHCGAHCPDRAVFCANCGTPLAAQQAASNPAPAQGDGMLCKTCNIQYPADYVWCERCRSRLEPVSAADFAVDTE